MTRLNRWSNEALSSASDRPARLLVNGEPSPVAAATLAELLTALGFTGQRVATALNGDFVPERARAETRLAAGDRIEIVSPRQGG